jgi:DNA repair protein RadC
MYKTHRERINTKFMNEGAEAFDDAELLEMLLFHSEPGRSTSYISQKLISKYGSFANVLEADYQDLLINQGISTGSAFLIQLIPGLSKRYFESKWGEKPIVNSSKLAGEYAVSLFIDRIYESFFVISLDTQNRVNHAKAVFEGTINEAPVYPRLILEEAIRRRANSVILAHNHPGGSIDPSNADIMVTKKIIKALEPISIKVVDHIIVAGGRYCSFAEKGMMQG